MLAKEEYVNVTQGFRCGDSGYYEPFTDNVKRLFREYQREYGRCVSKVYVEEGDNVRAIGWVFQKNCRKILRLQ